MTLTLTLQLLGQELRCVASASGLPGSGTRNERISDALSKTMEDN